MVEPARSQMTLWRCACWINKATRAQSHTRARPPTSTHTHKTHRGTHSPTHAQMHTEIYNTYRFSTATMITWTHLSVMLYVHCLTFYKSKSTATKKIYSLDFFLTILSHLIFYVRRLNMCHKRSSSPATQINLALIHVPKRYLYRFAR